jgi:hypothetical protein
LVKLFLPVSLICANPIPWFSFRWPPSWKRYHRRFFSIGGQEKSDILPAKQFGMKTIHISEKNETAVDYRVDNIVAAVAIIRKNIR